MATKVIRSVGSLVTSEDDARLFQQIFCDGLFNSSLSEMTVVQGSTVRIPTLYGMIQGRDFHVDAHSITVPLANNSRGFICVRIDLSKNADERVAVIGYLSGQHTIEYESINNGGTVAEIKIADYTCSQTVVTGITTNFARCLVAVNSTKAYDFTLYAANWRNGDYRFEDKRITDDSMQAWMPGKGITKAQYKALSKGMIVEADQKAGYVILRCLDKVPTIDIPVRVRFYDENSTIIA